MDDVEPHDWKEAVNQKNVKQLSYCGSNSSAYTTRQRQLCLLLADEANRIQWMIHAKSHFWKYNKKLEKPSAFLYIFMGFFSF